jgi:ubiquinone/menaquinone biosynthesis C-methylase UbiE
MNRNEKYSKANYDKIAHNYDDTFDGKFTKSYKAIISAMVTLQNGDCVLDVGCGNGSLIAAISKNAEVKAFGVDLSPKMIDECKKRYPHISFKVSSGELLPFDNNAFDCVTMCCVLHHLHTPETFFVEANRILKPGGTLIIGEPWMPVVIRQITDYIVSPLLRAGDNKLFSHKRFKSLFTANGFTIETVFRKEFKQIIAAKKSDTVASNANN